VDDLSTKTALVYDLSGSYTHIAETIAPDFARTLYHCQWETGFSHVQDYMPGVGLEGVERVFDPADHYKDVDLVIFPDVGLGGLQKYLRSQGLAIWGSARHERFERDRIRLKQVLQGLDLDVADYQVITGLKALREYLAENEKLWIKISYFRGITETHEHKSSFASQGWLDDLSVKLGPMQESIDFLVEEPIEGDAVEVGIDRYAIDAQVPLTGLWGYEDKDHGYIGTTGKTPDRLNSVTQRFASILDGYSGPLSTEVRVTKDQDFIVDFTARFPSPPSEAECLNIANLARLMYDGARGIWTPAEYRYKMVAQLVLASDVLEDHALAIKVGMPGRVMIHGHCCFDGRDYAASPLKIGEFAGAVGLNDDLEDAMAEALEAAESVEGDQVKFDASAFGRIMETIEQGNKLGLRWGLDNG
jgi:translation initiation factor IF-3